MFVAIHRQGLLAAALVTADGGNRKAVCSRIGSVLRLRQNRQRMQMRVAEKLRSARTSVI